MREHGARVAYETLIAVCQDPKAPAPAKATAGTTILRCAGFLEKPAASDDDMEALSEAELEATIARLKDEAAALDRRIEHAAANEASDAPERPAAAQRGRRRATSGLFD